MPRFIHETCTLNGRWQVQKHEVRETEWEIELEERDKRLDQRV